MIIILEGCDKTGKSTLAKKLSLQYDAEIIKTSQPKTSEAFKEYVRVLCGLDINKNYIFDRFHLGEMVYGPLYRNRSALTIDRQHYIEMKLLRLYGVLIYCSTDSYEVYKNFEKDKEDFTKKEDIIKIMMEFESASRQSLLPRMDYNYNHTTDDELSNFINVNNKKSTIDLNFIGVNKPSLLLVGDRLNAKSVQVNQFKSVFCSASGMFLIHTLRSLHWFEKTAIINSDELVKDGKHYENIFQFHPKIILSLGNNAWKTLNKLNIKSLAVSHPQFAKRFYGKNYYNIYANELAEKVKYGLLFKRWD